MLYWILAAIALLVVWLFTSRYSESYRNSLFWIWDNGADELEQVRERIDTDDIYFPANFLWGVATSAHQVSVSVTSP
jgi:hypothetical protein